MNKKEFVEELQKINIKISNEQLEKLDKYFYLLEKWNKNINLTRIIEEEDVYLKHFYDSLTLHKVVNLYDDLYLCDIGSGAGFPGLVLKIVFPNLKIVLVDALMKRINFLNIVINELELKEITAIHMRGEDYAKQNRDKFDIVTSRAVANLNILVEISIPMLKVSGYLIAMKSSCDEEISSSSDIIKKLNAKIVNIDRFLLPYEHSNRSLIKIEKISKTNEIYPRPFDKIKKSK